MNAQIYKTVRVLSFCAAGMCLLACLVSLTFSSSFPPASAREPARVDAAQPAVTWFTPLPSSFRLAAARPRVLSQGATVVVTSTTDSGTGSLRQAILSAIPGDIIVFDTAVFPPTSPATITLLSGLPDISQGGLTIDASNAGVVLDGRYAASGTSGLRMTSSDNTIKGLQIIRFPSHGIEVTNGAKRNLIGGDWMVGSAPHGEGNIITLNGADGVSINGAGTMSNTVSGNLIGLDADGTRHIGVQAIAFSPSYAKDPTLFIGTSLYGVWKTTDGGSSWAQVSSGLTISDVRALVVSPAYATDTTMFAGTASGGIFKTTNDGNSWTRVDGDVTHRDIVALMISPAYAADGHIFAATAGDGVLASTNGGITWTVRTGGLNDLGLTALAISPDYGADRTLFASSGSRIYKSVNQGYTWVAVSPDQMNCIHALAVSPDYANDQTVFAGLHRCSGVGSRFWKSTDRGNSWAAVGDEGSNNEVETLAISPNYAADQTLFAGDPPGVIKSDNGGASWTRVHWNRWLTVIIGSVVAVSPAYAQAQVVFVGYNGGGIFKSADGGSTWADVTGELTERGNSGSGVRISDGAHGNIIGGDSPGGRNIISHNDGHGVLIEGSGVTDNIVSGNYLGTNASGTAILGNGWRGVTVCSGAQRNVIERNLISGNTHRGITIEGMGTTNNTVIGNYIGTDASGTIALGGNGGCGVWITYAAQYNRIGGTTAEERNVVSGNDGSGVCIEDSNYNTITGNYIGTDASGTVALGNVHGCGVCIGNSQYNVVGGSTPGERNVISGNGDGVALAGSTTLSNTIAGNYIGTDASGAVDLGNIWVGDGIIVHDGAQHNLFGPDNVIAYNHNNGIRLWDSTTLYNTFTQNSIHSNGGMGIDLSNSGNTELSPPAIINATETSVSGIAPMAGMTIEIFSDDASQGRIYEGSTTSDVNGNFTFTKPAGLSGPYLTATATDGQGNTSEFSNRFAKPGPTPTPTAPPMGPTPTPGGPTPTPTPTPTATPLPSGGDTFESDDTCTLAKVVLSNGTIQNHSFHQQADVDWTTFNAISGTTYLIETEVPPDSPADVSLAVYDSCSGLRQGGQDFSFSPGVRLSFMASATGPLYLRLENHDPSRYGAQVAYQLSVRALGDAPTPGALIIVAGRAKLDDPLQSNIYHVTNAVRDVFLRQGYNDGRIYYLAPDNSLSGWDDTPSASTLQAAITTWASDKVAADRALTLYLMDHGDRNVVYLDKVHNEWVTPAQLDGWLTQLEDAVPGLKVNVIIEACYSGSFIDTPEAISKIGRNRVIVTSTAAQLLAHASSQGAVFSDQFLAALDQRKSLYDSFQAATWAVQEALPYEDQIPWLDDNGDGAANTTDGNEAMQRGFAYAGTFGEEQWPPYIQEAREPSSISGGKGVIQAKVLDDRGVDMVWAVIYPPSYQPPAGGTEIVKEILSTIVLLELGGGWYGASYPGFTEVGQYRMVVYAKDDDGLEAQPVTIGLQVGYAVYLPVVLR